MRLPGAADFLAPELMRHLSLFGDGDFEDGRASPVVGRSLTALCANLSVINYEITGRGAIFEDQLARIATLGNADLVTTMNRRTVWFDRVVDRFVADQSASNVVILGSGYDTRAYRLDSLLGNGSSGSGSVRVYEVDAPGTQARKLRALRRAAIDAGSPVCVSCDFGSEDWLESLRSCECGFDGSTPTLVVWEGVSMYLPVDVIRSTLETVARSRISNLPSEDTPSLAPWYIAFDYLNPKWAGSAVWEFATRLAGEPFLSSFEMDEIDNLLADASLDAVEHVRVDERHHCAGRSYGGFVLAGTRPAR